MFIRASFKSHTAGKNAHRVSAPTIMILLITVGSFHNLNCVGHEMYIRYTIKTFDSRNLSIEWDGILWLRKEGTLENQNIFRYFGNGLICFTITTFESDFQNHLFSLSLSLSLSLSSLSLSLSLSIYLL